MAAVTIHNDFRAQENEVCDTKYKFLIVYIASPFIRHEVRGPDATDLHLLKVESQLFHSSLDLYQEAL